MERRRRLKHESHDSARAVLRVVGPLLILVGGAMFVTGMLSFFEQFDRGPRTLESRIEEFTGSATEESEPAPPNRFWMCFVGMPLAGVGFVLSRYGYLGAAARYVAGETAPVARDTIDYIARGTKDSIREVAHAIRGDEPAGVRCPACGEGNDADAKFCDECGAALANACPSCHARNDADARFCDSCGTALEA